MDGPGVVYTGSMSESTYMVFGNPLPKKVTKKAKNLFRRYARRFHHDPAWQPDLRLRPMEDAWEVFGIKEYYLPETAAQAPDAAPASQYGNQLASQPSSPAGGGPGAAEASGRPAGGPLLATPVDRPASPGLGGGSNRGVVIGTIRMGFGHYRIGLALASAARSMDVPVHWLDFLGFPETCPSRVIRYLESLYNAASRLSQSHRLFNKLIWEKITSDVAQRLTYCARDRELSRLFMPLCSGLEQTGMPFVATHPWTGLAAVHAGVGRVVTAVPDNYPLAFHLVEGSIHGVQTPSAYLGYRTLRNMGYKEHTFLSPLPADKLFFAGHFVDHELVSNIDLDCDRRFRRLRDRHARRILLTMGGAGAQVRRFADIIRFCRQGLEEGRIILFLNMGDHRHRWLEMKAILEAEGIRYQLHEDWNEVMAFAREVQETDQRGIHVFLASRIFPAVYTTNLLMRASDIMITKPSELSFYPVPKLFIERVGRHEAWGAIRGAEIGDGTLETSSLNGLYQSLKTIMEEDDLLHLYCTNIIKNKEAGMYDGAYNIIKRALRPS